MSADRGGWYLDYFDADFWALAAHEYTPDRTRGEVEYLAEVLGEHGPGQRVLDLGCGFGRHAIELARHGFDVVGLDVSVPALTQAQRDAAEAGADARFAAVDLLSGDEWPVGEVDAVVWLQGFGWGADSDQRRMLRTARRHLAEGGILVLDHSNAFWIVRNYASERGVTHHSTDYRLMASFDVLSSRSRGTRIVSSDGEGARTRVDDFRLYTPAEAVAAVRASGFEPLFADADFTRGATPTLATRYVQVVARRAPGPPEGLAVATYAPAADPSPNLLDLRWNTDEDALLNPPPEDLWADVEPLERGASSAARRYVLGDPYGAERGRGPVARALGVDVEPAQLTFGAGLTTLLRDLSSLTYGGTLLAGVPGLPDTAVWAALGGAAVDLAELDRPIEELVERVRDIRPSLIAIERPTLTGRVLNDAEIALLARACASWGGIVLVDEAYAPYLGERDTCSACLTETGNLVLLRTVSKGWSCGGLRVGYAVSSLGIATLVRELVAPLEVSSLSFELALRLLGGGDALEALRSRVLEVKPVAVAALAAAGLDLPAGHPSLPWCAARDDSGALLRRLAGLGVAAKPMPQPSDSRGGRPSYTRLAIPLTEIRLEALLSRLARSP